MLCQKDSINYWRVLAQQDERLSIFKLMAFIISKLSGKQDKKLYYLVENYWHPWAKKCRRRTLYRLYDAGSLDEAIQKAEKLRHEVLMRVYRNQEDLMLAMQGILKEFINYPPNIQEQNVRNRGEFIEDDLTRLERKIAELKALKTKYPHL